MPFLAAIPAWVGTAAALAGTAISGVSAIASGFQQSAALKEQAKGARYNQAVAEMNAEAARKAAAFAEEQARKKTARLLGTQQAGFAKAGVAMEGTPLEVMAETAAQEEENTLALRYNYAVEASRWGSQAGFYGYESRRQEALSGYPIGQGFMKAGTALLTTAGNLWGGSTGRSRGFTPDYSSDLSFGR
jgi:predicted ATPase